MSENLSVAVLGLGIMGGGMAHRLANAGFALCVYNRSAEKTAPFQGKARIAASPEEAAAGADIIIAMLADDAASRALWLDGGALAAAKPGAILIECSTLSLSWGRALAQMAKDAGLGFIDAPVNGSKMNAAQGTLKFLVGGEAEYTEKARAVFAAMGSETIAMGPVGSGIAIKLLNNFLCGVQVASLAEALVIAEIIGLDAEKARDVLLNGAAASPLIKTVAARIVAGDYTPNFFTALIAKDLDYVAREAANLGMSLASAAAARARFLDAVSQGRGDQDIASVIEPLRKI